MLCYVCYVMLCYFKLCYVMLWYVMVWYGMYVYMYVCMYVSNCIIGSRAVTTNLHHDLKVKLSGEHLPGRVGSGRCQVLRFSRTGLCTFASGAT